MAQDQGDLAPKMMQKDTILILTQEHDGHADQVAEALQKRGHAFVRWDTADFPLQTTLRASYKREAWQGGLQVHDHSLDFHRIKSIWFRKPTRFQVEPSMNAQEARFAANEARIGIGGILRSLDCLWVNHPEHIVSATYKPYQLHIAHHCGLAIPPTLVTNDAQEVEQFFQECRQSMIYKALSTTTIQDGKEFANIYTTLIDEERLRNILPFVKNTACFFQKNIPKDKDLRITIIGRKVFATAIDSQHSPLTMIDFRRSYDALGAYHPYQLPEEIEQKLLLLMQRLGLLFGAVDMILTPDGDYYFLEANAVGQFSWLQAETGAPLIETIVDLLIAGKGNDDDA
jgi:ATP-grasp ribosomal peptide maturase